MRQPWMKHGDGHYLHYNLNGKSKRLQVFKVKDRVAPNYQTVGKVSNTRMFGNYTEITSRMNANKCEYCAKTGGQFEVHHIRKLADVIAKKNKTDWEKEMISRRRKTLVLCTECHDLLHQGKLQSWKRNNCMKMESRVQ